jgi:hypothetical protein
MFPFIHLKAFPPFMCCAIQSKGHMVASGCANNSGKPFWQHIGGIFETDPNFGPFKDGHFVARRHVNVGTDRDHVLSKA